MEINNSSDFLAGAEKPGSFLIAGIGASAGGIQALKEFFHQVPENSGIAYVVILHLSPDHDSQLAQVLQMVSAIPVLQVIEKTKIEPDHIYVVPPNQHLIIQDGFIAPSPNIHIEERRAPVDILFRNLADTHGPRAVCVVLSGTGANGSMGLKRIKEMGGVVYVQNPREAEFNEMPRNALATELVDEVLPVAEIPAKIIAYKNSLGTVQITVETESRHDPDQQTLREIFTQLRIHTGHDFTNYKRPTLLRRIERRINIHNLPDLPTYSAFLHQHTEEINALLKDLLISVTNFYRDTKPFKALESEVLSSIFQGKNANDQIRIWVAGCATGEEAYSIAISIAERIMGIIDAPKVQIFATDIDESAIATAREGYYTINDAADVPPERLQRYFTQEKDGYRIRREIREMILFANHNFLKDPPFSRLNLITCRNVLIYLNATAQERVMETFHFALHPGGFLFLGSSESVDGASDLYAVFSRENHIFQARESSVRNFPVPQSAPHFQVPKNDPLQKFKEKEGQMPMRISFGELHHKLLEQYAPPSLLINEEFEIVHMSEKVGRYFEFSAGEPTQNLLKLIRPEIRLELRSILYQAIQHKTPVKTRNIKLTMHGQPQLLDIQVRPVLQDKEPSKGFILVIFEQKDDDQEQGTILLSSNEPVAIQLEEELMNVKSQLRNLVEQYEYQAEELKASNEELQAMNEELRSAAEELETSKEELQSINEELRTVNQELKVKIEEISITSNNLQNLVNSADVGTIFLNRSFSIRLFTPAVLEIFNLKPSDIGRPITDITNKLQYDQLLQDAGMVLEKLTVIEHEVSTTDQRTFVMRLLPYRTSDDRINGVVITFFDITKRKQTEHALQRSEEYLHLLIESAKDYAIITLDPGRHVISWSNGAEKIMGYSEAEILGKSGDMIFTPEDLEEGVPLKEVEKAGKEGRARNERWHIRKDGSHFWGSGSVSPLRDNEGKLLGFVKILRDMTETRRLEEARFFLASIVETSNDSIVTINFDKKITSWNKAAEYLYGYPAEEAIGKSLDMLLLPKEVVVILNKIDRVTHSREVAIFDTVRVNKKGQYIDLEIVLSPVLNSLGDIIGVSTVARNVSERKRREAQLAFLSDLSRGLLDLSTTTGERYLFAEKTAQFFEASYCAFIEIEDAKDQKLLFEAWSNEDRPVLRSHYDLPEYRMDEFKKMLSSGQTVVVRNVTSDSRILNQEKFQALQIQSFVNVPIMHAGEWHFSLSIYLDHPYDWRGDEVILLQETGIRVWTSIERTRAEEGLRFSEERFRTLTNAVPQVIWANDHNGKANYFNQRWYEYSGLSFEASFGLGWEAIVHPNDAPASTQKWQQALASGNVFDTEYRLKNASGVYSWHIGRNVPLKDNSGSVIGWFGSATDIDHLKSTEALLRQTSERLQLALNAGQLGSYEYDFVSGEFTCTAQQKVNFGFAEEQPLSYEELRSLIIAEDRESMEARLKKSIEQRGIYEAEYRIQLKSGDIRWIRSVGKIIYNDKDEPQKISAITLDITEQKLFTDELRKQVHERTIELQRSNEDLLQFAHVASHDLKEPVRKVRTFSSRIIDEFADVLPGKVKTYLAKIETSTRRMYTMIDGVLAYSILTNSVQALEPVDLNEVIQHIITDLELMIQSKNAVITKANLPTITASSVLMYQLFYNLVLNSLKFSKAGLPPIISIASSRKQEDHKEVWQISVSDNGIGFDPEFEKAIFSSFTRLHPADAYEGTGLGLALCKKIVERHHGSISASGRKNEGASFTILLPVN